VVLFSLCVAAAVRYRPDGRETVGGRKEGDSGGGGLLVSGGLLDERCDGRYCRI